MKGNPKQILDTFQKHLLDNYHDYCAKHEIANNPENLLTYLIDRELMPANMIRKYTVAQEFQRLYPLHENHKSKTVETLADRFHLSTRHIWSLIKYSQRPEQRKKIYE